MMINHRLLRAFACVSLAACAAAAFAQSRQVPAPPQSYPIAILNATIHPVSSKTIERGYVLFDHGVITAVGAGQPAPELIKPGMSRINAENMHVYPGLIASNTYLGLTEIGDIDQTNDHTEIGRVKPEVRAAPAINPDTDLIPVTRSNGILTGLIFPRGGLVSGRCSSIRFDGWTWEDMTIDAEAGLVVNWPRTEPITSRWMDRPEEEQRKEIREDLDAIEKVFDDAAAYVAAKDNDPALTSDQRYEAMRPFLKGEKPVYVSAALVGQIESAVAWALRRHLKIVIVGGAQADQCVELLKKHDIPVIIGGIHRLPTRRQDDYDQPYALPAKLHAAGVRFCIASGDEAAHERSLNYMAATAAAYGLPKDEALKAVTLSAARIIGAGDRLGSLEPGKAATLILTSSPGGGADGGDPLEITTDTLVAFIDGRRIDLGNRQTALYEKYQAKYRQLGLLKD